MFFKYFFDWKTDQQLRADEHSAESESEVVRKSKVNYRNTEHRVKLCAALNSMESDSALYYVHSMESDFCRHNIFLRRPLFAIKGSITFFLNTGELVHFNIS